MLPARQAGRSASARRRHLGQQVHAQAYTLPSPTGCAYCRVAAAFLLIMLFYEPLKPSYQD